MISSFADLLHPISPEQFFAEYFGKQPLHIPGGAEKMADLMSWKQLNGLLEITNIWTSDSLELVLDQKAVAPAAYCIEGRTRDLRRAMKPDRRKVLSFLQRGATMALDFCERLTPELIATTEAIEDATGGAITGSIFCSWEGHQGFASHHDTLDVFAVQTEGEKLWKLWEGRYDSPVDIDGYNSGSFGVEHHMKHRGALKAEITMRPGDVLYVPIGMYHDALALPGGSVHVSFGVNRMFGKQYFDMLAEECVQDPAFRRPMPDFRDRAAVAAHLAELAERFKQAALAPHTIDFFIERMRHHTYGTRAGYNLPNRDTDETFIVRSEGLKLVRRGSDFQLKLGETAIVVSATQKPAVDWVLSQERFTTADFNNALSDVPHDDRRHIVRVLAERTVLIPL